MNLDNAQQSLIAHLIELRTRLVRALLAIFIVFIGLFHWSNQIYSLLARPLLRTLPKGGQLIATEVTAPFLVPMKVTLLTAFLLVLPYVLYQIWSFIAPGLYTHEKKIAVPMLVSSVMLFYCGMAFAYFLVFPVVFGFISSVTPAGVAMMTDISKYSDFVMTLFLAFGFTFEVPVLVVLLVSIGVVNVAKLREIRPYMIVAAFVIGAIFTPPDVISQTMLAVPLWVLYELGILAATLIDKQHIRETPHQDTFI